MGTINPVRIRLRFPDVDTFVEKFAPNVTRGGLFLASRNIQPVGATIVFEIQLMTGAVALAGQGKVTWVKEFNPAEPNRPYGMGVQFVAIEPGSRAVLARILRAKEAGQAPPRGFTAAHATLTAAGLVPAPNNGRPGSGAIDTSVDLASEFGIDDAALRLALDRRRVNVTRVEGRVDDDLSDLLKPEPSEAVTLMQALAELPRLLDPQNSRRRAAVGFRPVDPFASSGPVVVAESVPATSGSVPTQETQDTETQETQEEEVVASETTSQTDEPAPVVLAAGPSPSGRGGRSSRRRRA